MGYSIPVKSIAVILTALALVLSFSCVLGIAQAEEYDLYTQDFDDWVHQRLEWQAYDLASGLAERYAISNLSNCSTQVLRELGYRHFLEDVLGWSGFSDDSFSYTISAKNGIVLDSMMQGPGVGLSFETVCSSQYPVMVTDPALADKTYGKDFLREETVSLGGYDEPVTLRYYDSPKYTVVVTLLRDAALNRYGSSVPLVESLYTLRFAMMWILAVALLILGAGLVYLCCSAGKAAPNAQPRLTGLNRLPLDLYLLIFGTGGTALGIWAGTMIADWFQQGKNFNYGTVLLAMLLLFGVALAIVGFLYILVAQLKQRELYWWHNSVTHKLVRILGSLTRRIPMVVRQLLSGAIIAACVILTTLFIPQITVLPLLAVLTVCAGSLCYRAYAYSTLLRGARQMSHGQLDHQIDTRYLFGEYAQCARYLNDLADVAVVAARNQMRSERMKTELITNVSHDIKTPLTSIINYVDLLQQASSRSDSQQYLEVLGRQSQRLKKLIEDLMELSRASSGNMNVTILAMDAGETVNQALGEFSDKLASAGLEVVWKQPETPLSMLADGRMTWRVLSNLLSNTVKYALPGTRVYLEAVGAERTVQISVKNISREPLTVSAEDLTERFVRGDASRNTEGSGLGLNIAKSLMELQKGSLELTVDGDLFKVTLTFPAVP